MMLVGSVLLHLRVQKLRADVEELHHFAVVKLRYKPN